MDAERSCRSKQTYLTKAHAKAVVRLMGAKHRDQFHLYGCGFCGYWHVAHLVPAFLRARRAPGLAYAWNCCVLARR